MRLTILHLSDPQLGRNHRFPAPGQPGSLGQRLREDLDRTGVQPDLVCITGDIAEWARPGEYRQAGVFLSGLAEALGLPRERFLLVPGNHDVSWAKYQAHVLDCQADEREPEPPFWPKWQPFKTFLDGWYGPDKAAFLPGQPWSWWELPDLDLAVAGLNSTLIETDEEHRWSLGEEQLRWFSAELHNSEARWRLGLVHHHLFRDGLEAERDRRRLRDLPLDLLLHGHTHEQSTEALPHCPVLGVGSVGVERNERAEDVANQYQVLVLEADGTCRRSLRRYHGPHDSFKDDNDILRPEDRAFSLAGAPRHREDRGRFAPAAPGGDLVDRVMEVARLKERDHDGQTAEVRRLDGHAFQVRCGMHRRVVGVCDRLSLDAIDGYTPLLVRYRQEDPTLPGLLVYKTRGEGREEDAEALGEALSRRGIEAISLPRYQELVDFTELRQWQRQQIDQDTRYPDEGYVDQAIVEGVYQEGARRDRALDHVRALLDRDDDLARMVLLLAPFGTGKTYLVRQLSRRLEETWEDGRRVPIWIELRHLEKAGSFEQLLAAHLSRAGQRVIDHDQLDYLRREGRVILLFDGFDELVLRVSYDRATAHLDTLVAAARGRARVLVTSRTEHFLTTDQAARALLRHLAPVEGLKVLHLQEFDDQQKAAFLDKRLGAAGAGRLTRLRAIPNLLELARTPRMLSMLAQLDDADLDQVEQGAGEVTAARLYETLLEKWLSGEQQRRTTPGSPPPLGASTARQAVTLLAARAWRSDTGDLAMDELGEVAASLSLPRHSVEEATQELGSGTLLVRDESDPPRFRFAHQSMLEYLVARQSADALLSGEPPELLDGCELTAPLARFLGELAGPVLDDWVRRAARPGNPEARRAFAQALAAHRGVALALCLAGQDLRGRDDLRALDLRGADLSGADLRGLDLSGVDLSGAKLDGANLGDVRLAEAVLEGVVGTPRDTMGASLLRARGVEALDWAVDPDPQPEIERGGPIVAGARSPDGRWLAMSLKGEVRLVDTEGRQRRSLGHAVEEEAESENLRGRGLKGHRGSIHSAALAGADRLATASEDGTVRIWNSTTGKLLHELKGHSRWKQAVASAPDGRLATVAHDGSIHTWDPTTGTLLQELKGHRGRLFAVAFSPDGRLATAGSDNTIRIWDPTTGTLLHELKGHRGTVYTAAFSPDGRLATAGSDSTIRIWEPTNGTLLHELHGHSESVFATAFSPNGHLASAGDDSTIRIWDPTSGTLLRELHGHRGTVYTAAFSPNGHLATAGDDGTVRTWDPTAGTLIHELKGHRGTIYTAVFTSPGRLVTGGADGTIRTWDLATGRQLAWFAGGPRGAAVAVRLEPDGGFKMRTQGEARGWTWISHGLHRYEIDEVARWFPDHVLGPDEPLLPPAG